MNDKRLIIDGAISHAKEIAEKKYIEGMLCHANPNDDQLDKCIECGKEYEQLVKWLEELKQYYAIGTVDECREAIEKKKLYSSKRWTDNPGFRAVENKAVIFIEEEKREDDKKMEKWMRSCGALKPDEHIIDSKVVRTDENGIIKVEK